VNHNKEISEDWFGFSIKHLILILIGTILFGLYIGELFYGENSVKALKNLKSENRKMREEIRHLRVENQKLQKKYFELLQLTE